MTRSEQYEQRAADCIRLSETASDATNKALLYWMAYAWSKLAVQAKAQDESGADIEPT
jgi:hypothetical protein